MRYAKVLGLTLLAALTLLALIASVTNAGEIRGDIKLNGQLITELQPVDGELEDAVNSSLLVPSLNFAIRCHAASVTNGVVHPLKENMTTGSGTITFKGCLAFEHTTLNALTKCVVEGTPGGFAKEIVTKVKIRIVRTKAGGIPYVLVAPVSGLVFTEITFGALCGALAEETIEVKESVVAEPLTLEAVRLPIKEAPEAVQLLFNDKLLLFGAFRALLDGDFKLLWTGDDEGEGIGIEAGA